MLDNYHGDTVKSDGVVFYRSCKDDAVSEEGGEEDNHVVEHPQELLAVALDPFNCVVACANHLPRYKPGSMKWEKILPTL